MLGQANKSNQVLQIKEYFYVSKHKPTLNVGSFELFLRDLIQGL